MGHKKRHSYNVVNSTPDMAARLAEIQRACFPTLAADELIRAEQFISHIKIFPEGQFAVVTEKGLPVASSTDLMTDMDFGHIEHTYMAVTGDNWLTTHNPKGPWLYGCDIGVHPDFRGEGLSTLLYTARQNLTRRKNMKGHVAGSVIKGFHKYKAQMDAKTYVDKVVRAEIHDPVLSIQLKRGFQVAGVIQHYLDDPSCDNKAALIVWQNPEYTP